ncbi:hypothetical protein LEMLEM_LOCUS14237 [Lemmus lemmus]
MGPSTGTGSTDERHKYRTPSIVKNLVVQYLSKCQAFFLWTTFVRHSCCYIQRASWIPLPTFRLFTHNAGFTDPFLNRERKRDGIIADTRMQGWSFYSMCGSTRKGSLR